MSTKVWFHKYLNFWNIIMGFIKMFTKSMMKNAYLSKISISLQSGSEVIGLLSSNDSIPIF